MSETAQLERVEHIARMYEAHKGRFPIQGSLDVDLVLPGYLFGHADCTALTVLCSRSESTDEAPVVVTAGQTILVFPDGSCSLVYTASENGNEAVMCEQRPGQFSDTLLLEWLCRAHSAIVLAGLANIHAPADAKDLR